MPGAPYTWVKPTCGAAGHLASGGPALQLAHDLVHLPQPRRADRLAVGEQPAVGVDRQRTVDLGRAVGEQLLLLAVRAQPGLGQVDDLRAAVGVLQLRDLHVGRVRPRRRANAAAAASTRRARVLARATATARTPRTTRTGGRATPTAASRTGASQQVERPLAAGEHERHGTGVGRAEHVARQRRVDQVGVEHRLLAQRLAPPGERVVGAVAERLGRDPGQRLLGDAVLVEVAPGLEREVLRRDHHPGLAVPVGEPVPRRCGVERAAGVVVVARPPPPVSRPRPAARSRR